MIKHKPSRIMLLLMQAFIFLNIIDVYTTYVVLGLGGQKMNPLLACFNGSGINILTILFIKIIIPLLECVAIYALFHKAKTKKHPHAVSLSYLCIIILFLITLIISVNNILHTVYQLQEIDQVLKAIGVHST